MTHTAKQDVCPTCGAPIASEAPQGLCPKCVLAGASALTEPAIPNVADAEVPSLERVAAAFPQLEIIELIGCGGMGYVFKARQPHLDRFVALKLLPDKLAKDPRFAERFHREGRVLAKLNHPNIVAVYDFGRTEHFYHLMMEFVDGVNLRDAMQAGRFSPAEALSIVPKICDALQYAHRQGVLHRDIKPANILLDTQGQVKLADFGIAKLVGDAKPDVTLTGTGAALGTPHYMAPEQLEKPSAVDHRADIYSLGVVFYEMLTGELPIGRFAAPSTKTPVGIDVDQVVFRTLEKDRERRYQSAGELKTQVEHLTEAADQAGSAPPPNLARGMGQAEPPKWSAKAIWAAVLTGASLPLPLMLATIVMSKQAWISLWEMLIVLVVICAFGLPGTILGWIALSDIRAHAGRLRGVPLAVFGALTWPLLVLIAVSVAPPSMLVAEATQHSTAPPRAAFLLFLPAAGALTFVLWAVYATIRWATNQPPSAERGRLKWVFLLLLLTGIGPFVLSGRAPRVAQNAAAVPTDHAQLEESFGAEDVDPMIQFTFTSVELREEAGARWLEMDSVQQALGNCEPAYPWVSDVPGWTCEVRATSFRKDSDKRFPPVHGYRVSWKLPNALDLASARAFRARLAKQWLDNPFVVPAGNEQTVFVLSLPNDQGTLTAKIAARLREERR